MAERLGFLDYVRAAFWRRVPVPGLGELPLHQMALAAFAVLGLANPGFWFLGAAAEVAYLFGLASSRRFQKLVDGERLLDAQRSWEGDVRRTVEYLDDDARARYRALLAQCRTILGLSESHESESLGHFLDLRARSLNQLLTIFLRLLRTRQLIEGNFSPGREDELRAELDRVERQVTEAESGDNPALARALRGNLDIQRRRLEAVDRAARTQRVLDAELLRIEQQVELIREEAALSGSPRYLADTLDAVTTTMDETTRFLEENQDLLGPLWAQDRPVANLPRLPEGFAWDAEAEADEEFGIDAGVGTSSGDDLEIPPPPVETRLEEES